MSQSSFREIQIQKTRDTILSFIKDKKYTLVTNINDITKDTDFFTYICFCGEKRERKLSNIKNCIGELNDPKYVPDCCTKKGVALLIDPDKWFLNNTINEYKDSQGILWKLFSQYWISEKGTIIGSKGIPLEYTNNEFKFSKKVYKLEVIMAQLFLEKEYKEKSKTMVPYFEDDIVNVDKIRFKPFDQISINLVKGPKNPNLKSTRTKDKVGNIEHYLSQEYKEHPEFKDYMFFKDGIVIKKPFCKNKDYTFAKISEENGFSVIRLENRHRVDKIILLCFDPYDQDLSYQDYKNVIIRHKDGNMMNNALENLEYYSNDKSTQERIENSKKERIRSLHTKLKEYIATRKATLISNINSIKTVRCEFEYKCACDLIFKKTLKSVQENGNSCSSCNSKLLKMENEDESLFFEQDGELFKKFKYGWVSNKGKILNNLKKELSQHKGYVKISETLYNVKTIITETFKIPYYELLGIGSFYLKTIDGTENYGLENIYVWTNSKADQKLIPDNIEINNFVDKNKVIEDTKYLFLEESQVPKNYKEFMEYRFYENGLIKLKNKNIYTYGRKTKEGYMDISIKKIYRVHRILCFLFHPIDGKENLKDYEKHFEVNHKDGNKCNNHIDNLEWTTKSENCRHALENDLCGYTIPVNLFKIDSVSGKKEFVKRFITIEDAHKETGFSKDYIKRLINNKTTPYSEYTFERAQKQKKINYLNIEEFSEDEQKE